MFLSWSYSLSNSSSLCICFQELHQISAICHYLSEDVAKKLLYLFFQAYFTATCFWRSVLSILFLKSKRYWTMLPDLFSEHSHLPISPDLFSEHSHQPISLLCFILFTGYLWSRGLNTSCLCFALRSFLIKPSSAFQNFFTFTLLPGSSTLLQTPECSEYHPSTESPVVSTFSYQVAAVWNHLPISVRHSTSVLSNLTWKPFSFQTSFFQSHFPQISVCVRVRVACSVNEAGVSHYQASVNPANIKSILSPGQHESIHRRVYLITRTEWIQPA